ncbi:MAG: hypothetical protein ACYCVO_08710 [Acidimicrobiales bacterium]
MSRRLLRPGSEAPAGLGRGASQVPHGHGGHGWMMVACCIPMLAVAIGLVAAGVVSAGFLLVALGCTAMMALMMRGMDHGGHGSPHD